jgi:hypothetical protein
MQGSMFGIEPAVTSRARVIVYINVEHRISNDDRNRTQADACISRKLGSPEDLVRLVRCRRATGELNRPPFFLGRNRCASIERRWKVLA